MSYRMIPFVFFSVLLLSGCWETQCLTGPDAAGRACYEEQQRETEACERDRPRAEEQQAPDYRRY